MTGLVLLFVVLALASLLVGLVRRQIEAQRKRRLVRELRQTDERVGRDAKAARRAMNDAAGQSWRNRFE